MTWVEVEDTVIPVDTRDVGWKAQYQVSALGSKDFQLIASILKAYHHLTDPLVDDDDAVAALRRAREAVAKVREEEHDQMRSAVAKEWVLDCEPLGQEMAFLLGPYTRSEAEERAERERKRNPEIHVALRKTMP